MSPDRSGRRSPDGPFPGAVRGVIGRTSGYSEETPEKGFAMVQREKVTDAVGRQWVTGSLDSDVYFTEVRRRAREQAERLVAARLGREFSSRVAGTKTPA